MRLIMLLLLMQEGQEEEEEEKKKTGGGMGRKEKSVLQAKLTKLAIQIGYAGNFYLILHIDTVESHIITRQRPPADVVAM